MGKTIDEAAQAQEDWDSMVEATIDRQICAEMNDDSAESS